MAEPTKPPPAQAARGPKSPLLALTLARIRIFVREPAALFWVFGFPVLLAVGLGIAFREGPVEPVHVGLPAGDPGTAEVQRLLDGKEGLAVEVLAADALEERLAKGTIDIIVRYRGEGAEKGAAAAPEGAGAAVVDLRFDPARDEGRFARRAVDDALQRALGREDVATITEHTEIPRGRRYIDFLLPGLIAMNLLGSSLWGVGYAIVQERRGKLLRRFAVTPMRRSDFLLSFLLSRFVFLFAEVVALLGFGALAFDVTVMGSVVDVGILCVVGALSFMGIAAVIGARTDSVEVASGFMNLATLPMWILSGTFFSYERFPEAVQPIIQALPLTALNDGLRAVVNDGRGLIDVLPQLAVLVAWGVVGFAIGLKTFRWR
ncbi:MAG: ABC transporter permease [Deltaproteobacteria bacterium]|nr:ABC transporter permease [Deltaproteobacteria bacterium]